MNTIDIVVQLEALRALRGPNLWSERTCLEATVKLTALSERVLDAARSRVMGGVRCTEAPGRATESAGLQLVRLLADAVVEVQRQAGAGVSFCHVAATATADEFRMAVEYDEEETGRAALSLVAGWMNGDVSDGIGQREQLAALRRSYEEVRLGPSTRAIAEAARRRGIPVARLNGGSLVRLGQGARQRRIWAAETDATSSVAEAIAQDKELTKSLLHAVGVPVPMGEWCVTAEGAWESAQRVGLPVVVKPRKGNQGRGVSVNLTTRDEVVSAFHEAMAARVEGEIIVERYIPGDDYRVLVIGGKVVAAARRLPPQVDGDGLATVRELVAEVNKDPRRGEDHATELSKLLLDGIAAEVLRLQGLAFDSVPYSGQRVILRNNANLSTGGTAVDVTDELHPEVAARAVEAVRMIGLDVGGVDIVASGVDEPLEVTGGAIVEVNAAPGLRMHLAPSQGRGRDVGAAIVATLFAPGDRGRVPVVAVTGTNGKTTVTRCVAHLLRGVGHRVGLTCTDGVYIDDLRIDTGDCSGPKSARLALAHPEVTAAVLETARGGMLREGLGFDYCDVAIVTNVADGDHLGMKGSETIEELAKVKSLPVHQVSPRGAAVLNAADPLVVAMAKECPGTVIFFARDAENAVLKEHRSRGGRVAFSRDGLLYVAIGKEERVITGLRRLPLTRGGRIGFQVENILAATAAAWFLGLDDDTLGTTLESFDSTTSAVPGRFNVVEHQGSTILLDYGHNAAALRALVDTLGAFPHSRRKVVYSAAGDRRDEDIIEQSRILAEAFDEIVIYEDKCTRGRLPGEVMRLMRMGFELGKRLERITEAGGEMAAIEVVLEGLTPGDLFLCQVDQVEEGLAFVTGWCERHADWDAFYAMPNSGVFGHQVAERGAVA